ncbi:hypothetical protein Cni_G22692 [Canna indica]|uniref:Uncharacterized protein n=1 Tax=Canna indica TaxID=4628 RepID=A0AAQ3KUM1_9LILI|nr:hypothetical protein Cni_G22692 [Canna indica]
MATGAEGLLRCVFEGCIPASSFSIEQRPYHRDCKCALHRLKGCAKACPRRSIAYPVRRRGCGAISLAAICVAVFTPLPLVAATSSRALEGGCFRPRRQARRVEDWPFHGKQ